MNWGHGEKYKIVLLKVVMLMRRADNNLKNAPASSGQIDPKKSMPLLPVSKLPQLDWLLNRNLDQISFVKQLVEV